MVKRTGDQGKVQKTLFQHNYIDVISEITPDLYKDTDSALFGSGEDVLYATLGKVLSVVDNIDGIFSVSSTHVSSLHQRFIPRNNLTNIRPYIFDQKILHPLGRSLAEFTTKEEFQTYLSGVLLPLIPLNAPSPTFTTAVELTIDNTVTHASGTHQYLLDTLSWFYVLNSSTSVGGGTDPSALLVPYLAKLWEGETLTERESVSLMFEYFWTNRELSTEHYNYIPPHFSQTNSQVSADIHTSGTQQFDTLKTLLHIWYNPNDESSTVLDDYIDIFINQGTFTTRQVEDGAFTKFLQAISFGFYDVNSTIEDLGNLVDIERCPGEFLPQLASLIGWKLMTGDIDRWRAQLRKAVYLYKAKGTRKSLEEALELVFTTSSIIPVDEIEETWEMFLPRMVYYLIATESATLNDSGLSPASFKGITEARFNIHDLDSNYRAATDYVLEILHSNTAPTPTRPEGGCIYINGNKYDLSSWETGNPNFTGFYHRNLPDCPVPPWEDDRFYDTTYTTKRQVRILNDLLLADASSTSVNSPRGGLGIPLEYVGALSSILLHESIDTSGLYYRSWNRKWKFHSPSYSKPPNLTSVIEGGDPKKIGLFDYWQSKSSLITAQIYLGNFDILSNRLIEDGIPSSPSKILTTVRQVFKQFLPFHVIAKIFENVTDIDTYTPLDPLLCIRATIDTFDLSPSGDFDHYILTNLVASSVSLLYVDSSGTDTSSNYVMTEHPATARSTGRRRNLKYLNTFRYYNRSGKAMPIHRNSLLEKDASAYSGLGAHTSEFVPLGYNFSSGKYFHTSSQVYDASNDLAMSALPVLFGGSYTVPGTEYYLPEGRSEIVQTSATFDGVAVSSTFPCRAPFTHLCVSVPTRDTIRGIKQIIISSLVRQGLTTDFGDKTLNDYKFGNGLMRDYATASGTLVSSTFYIAGGVDASANEGIKYSKKELETIYSHFNEMTARNASRVPGELSEMFQHSGGSRGYYLDPLGTDDPGTYGLASSGAPTILAGQTGTLFTLYDD
tara:strand:+ start:5702 stop:8728 length:3027 start_codon:yes stop_codon:yes gene_type:complete